ncbi:MAG: outer membrane lipoprotein carrier protein LolA [Chlorobiota bacterium]|nr:outer membrane lipoprotein carrier protein LolA [Chlorobiota bacterium]QQS65678.1 MAG: outer membrane lipoprotein carrier protein LolA [Chlorobiota bacterium]
MIYITILFSLNLLNSIEFKTDVTQFVNKTKQFYSSVNTAEISFEQTSANSDKIRGKMYYSKGNKYNIWYGDKTIICNGVKVWNINSKLSQVIITKAITKRKSILPSDIFTSFPGDYNSEYVSENKGSMIIKCTPQNISKTISDISSAVLHINKKDNTFQRLILNNDSFGEINIKILSSKYNTIINPNKFSYNPSPNVKIIDLTK